MNKILGYKTASNSDIFGFIVRILSQKFNNKDSPLYLPKLITSRGNLDPYNISDVPKFQSYATFTYLSNLVLKGTSNAQVIGQPEVNDGTVIGTVIFSSIKGNSAYPEQLNLTGQIKITADDDPNISITGSFGSSILSSKVKGKVQFLSSPNDKIIAKILEINFDTDVSNVCIDKVNIDDSNWSDFIKVQLNSTNNKQNFIGSINQALNSTEITMSLEQIMDNAIDSIFSLNNLR